MSEEIVFCLRTEGSGKDAVYDAFFTEDDVRLLAVSAEVWDGKMTSREAFALYPEYEVGADERFTEDDEPELIFPDFDSLIERERWPGRGAFYAYAEGIGSDEETGEGGAGEVTSGLGPASGLIWQIQGADVLAQVRSKLRGEYNIVVSSDGDYTGPNDRAHAERLIEEARAATDLGE